MQTRFETPLPVSIHKDTKQNLIKETLIKLNKYLIILVINNYLIG